MFFPGWSVLMNRVQVGDTVVAAWLDRFGRTSKTT